METPPPWPPALDPAPAGAGVPAAPAASSTEPGDDPHALGLTGPHADGASPSGRLSGWRRRLAPAAAALVAGLAKLKTLLLLLPKVKVLASLGTMLVSLAAYAALFGWQYAAGVIALLFVHEMGHVVALRREGIRATAPMFIPFMGALIAARSMGENALAEARVGLAGPVVGSVGAAVAVGLWHATGNDLFRALAYFGFFFNLFNLVPVVPLDGGRAMAAMSPWMWFLGFAGLIPLIIWLHSPLALLILLFAGRETWVRWRRLRSGEDRESGYYEVGGIDRVLVGAVYLALAAVLVVGMNATHLPASLS